MNISSMIIEFSSMNSMKHCLKKGLGLTICPEIAITNELKQGDLIQLNCNDIEDETSVIMIRHAQKWCSPILEQFLTLSEKRFHL